VSREGNGEITGLKKKGMTGNRSKPRKEEIEITILH
jgi:hypothetical protein